MTLKINTYLDHDVFGEEPNWTEPVPQEFTHDYDFSRNIGVGVSFSQFIETAVRLNGEWLFQSKADIQEFKDFFADKIGMLEGFWIPTWQSDLVVTAAIDATDAQLTIEDIGYADSWLNNAVYGRHIAIIFPDGTQVYRKIQGAPSSTTVALGAAVGKACRLEDLQSLLVSFLAFVRFDQDKEEREYETPSVARCSLRFKTISDEMTASTTTTTTSSTTTTTNTQSTTSSSTSTSSSTTTTNTQSTTSSSTASSTSSSSTTSTTVTLPPGEWVSHFDDADWEVFNGLGAWDDIDQEWDSVFDEELPGEIVFLRPIGVWAIGYRPLQMRITVTFPPNAAEVVLSDQWEAHIGFDEAYTSGDAIDLSFGVEDINNLIVGIAGGPGTFHISNIEFYEA